MGCNWWGYESSLKQHLFIWNQQLDRDAQYKVFPLLLSLAGSACSFNSVGPNLFINYELVENGSSKAETYQASGLHAYSKGAIGLHLGRIERKLIYPLHGSDPSLCYSPNRVSFTANDTGEYADDPFYIFTNRQGFGIELSRYRLSILLGVQKRHLTQIPATADAVFYFDDEESVACGIVKPEED